MSEGLRFSADVTVVGAGVAGAALTYVLGRQGYRVVLVDPRQACPPLFKAEKIEPEQAELLRKLGLLPLLTRARRIHEIKSYYRGKLLSITPTEQYGIRYEAMVNAFRSACAGCAQFRLGRVLRIESSDGFQVLTLDTGDQLRCRLAVVACGISAGLLASLNLKRVAVQKRQSIALGFTLARPNATPFPFDAVTYYQRQPTTGVDYVSIFPLDQQKRANLFAFTEPTAPWVHRFIREPNLELPKLMPGLSRSIGDYRIVGKVESSAIDLYHTEGEPAPAIVPIGDAWQNVCPATGSGLMKVFNDIDLLCTEYIPRWFNGAPSSALSGFLSDSRKKAVDERSMESAVYMRNACTAQSPGWRLHRTRLYVSMQIGRLLRTIRQKHGELAQVSSAAGS